MNEDQTRQQTDDLRLERNSELISWLLDSDVSMQYQVYRDLLGEDRSDLQSRIATEGWGKQYLDKRLPNGHWGYRYYQPKWISSHYTLLDLRNLCLPPDNPIVRETLEMILTKEKGHDGGINPAGSILSSDVCMNGMMLNVCCWFRMDESLLKTVIDYMLTQILPDGGFNCMYNRSGARHSSLHSTISVIEGLLEYRRNGYTYRLDEVVKAEKTGQEFLLMHRLYKSDRSGEIIHPRFLRLPYPSRWYYDILRALDYFADSGIGYDSRMQDAIEVLLSKQTRDGRWKLQAAYPGQVHFKMEEAGKVSRWNTLRAWRVIIGLGIKGLGIKG